MFLFHFEDEQRYYSIFHSVFGQAHQRGCSQGGQSFPSGSQNLAGKILTSLMFMVVLDIMGNAFFGGDFGFVQDR